MMEGIRKVAEAVGVTMGTAGKNSMIQCIENPGYYVTNDGYSIANNIKLADPLEELGRLQLIEAINKANKASGDGSSTTCVLTAAILEEGLLHLDEVSPMEIKRSLDACIPLIEESIKKQSRQITVDQVWQVASVSAEDEEIGKRIGEIYRKIGKEGVINWEAAKVPEDSYEIGTGIKMEDSGYVTPYLCDIDAATGWFKNEARLKDVPVFLIAQKLANLDALGGQFKLLNDKGHSDCLVFVNEVTPEVVGQLIATRQQKGFRAMLVRIPTLYRDEWWEDLAIASGATVISNAVGVPLNSIEERHVGSFGNVIVRKDETIVDGTKDMNAHIMQLSSEGDDGSLARAFRLNLKTARYFVGSHSESSLAYRRLKVEDAINAASEALDGGIVAGGGKALVNAARDLVDHGDVLSKGVHILGKALLSPYLQIRSNTEAKTHHVSQEETANREVSFDSRTGKLVNMFDAGIVDPAKVVLSAVKAAIGVASGVLTLGTVVLFPQVEQKGERQEAIMTR